MRGMCGIEGNVGAVMDAAKRNETRFQRLEFLSGILPRAALRLPWAGMRQAFGLPDQLSRLGNR